MENQTEITEQQRKQNTFNAVWKHSTTMTHQSFDEEADECQYRAQDGNCCFIGALIPDSLYQKRMENLNPMALFEKFPAIRQYFIDEQKSGDESFLSTLQSIHDKHFDNREEQLRELAEKDNLTVPA